TFTESEDQGSQITFDDCATKILGIKWLPQEDTFAFSTRSSRSEGRLTKRLVLSEVAQILDPLGFASPVVIKTKILLQELWLHKLQWDDPLPSQLSARWLIIREELTSLAKLSIPRWLNTWNDSQVEHHGFSDASQLAMAAVIYISVHDSNGATFSLVCSKTKVVPRKRLSIPQLELTAVLLLSRLMQYVKATLNMDVTATHMWTESLATLSWITSVKGSWIRSHASRWKDFVRNRVAQIQELTPAAHWRYIPGTSNPADCASRGLTTTQLQNHALWWTGPPWILKPDSWPSQPALSDEMSATEARPGVSLLTVTPRTEYQWELIYRYSHLTKILRITALCFRFVSRLRKVHDSLPVRHISPETLEKARLVWIQATQATYFSHELKALQADSPLAQAHAFNRLTAYIDAQGVIRVGGRLAHAARIRRDTSCYVASSLSAVVIDHRSRSSTDSTWRHAAHAVTHPTTILDSRREGHCQVSHPAVCHVCSSEGDPCSSIDGPTTSLSGYAGTTVHSYRGGLRRAAHRQNLERKRHHRNNEIKVGSLVLIIDERLPPCKWPLARITALHPGKDGLVRVVTLKTPTTTLIRPVVKLAVLPISS
ncbi:PREDICTED: uncharacterized protein LOC105561342, partial [Vollenhovia emeryi]|uniref:uncharacterized protein LOC105561342 n=1 Tax=Vollenhovia emeryi TaxID=411798 RepID=UPI0005F551F0